MATIFSTARQTSLMYQIANRGLAACRTRTRKILFGASEGRPRGTISITPFRLSTAAAPRLAAF